MATKQRTFTVDGEKITIRSCPKTYMRNPNGFYVWINGIKYPVHNKLHRDDAEEWAFAKWVQAHTG